MLGVTEKGTITAMRKEGAGSLDSDSISDMMEVCGLIEQFFMCKPHWREVLWSMLTMVFFSNDTLPLSPQPKIADRRSAIYA